MFSRPKILLYFFFFYQTSTPRFTYARDTYRTFLIFQNEIYDCRNASIVTPITGYIIHYTLVFHFFFFFFYWIVYLKYFTICIASCNLVQCLNVINSILVFFIYFFYVLHVYYNVILLLTL